MQPTDDSVLLRQYAENHSDTAFAALVTRHVNLVYSVALRCVGDSHQAEEVAQAVFILLAKKAAQLRHDKALSSWLFQTTRLTASNFVRGESRRHRREQEAHVQSVLNEPGSGVWPRIAPMLDDAVAGLNEKDRQAIVLRFYEGRNLREVGAALGASAEAAEKRVNRAVEKLRTFFAKRGVTFGASGIVVVISANAVQAAPVGLAVTISTAAALAGTTVVTTATATATATAAKTLAMTALQKTLIAATLVAAVGTGVYEARQASTLRSQVRMLQQQQASPTAQMGQLIVEREELTRQLVGLREENERLNRNTAELLKLRGEVGRLNKDSQELARLKAIDGQRPKDPMELAAKALLGKMNLLKQRLAQMPDLNIPELRYLENKTWARIANEHDLETDDDVRQALGNLRDDAKRSFAPRMGKSLINYIVANNGQLPTDVLQLKPYFESPVGDALLQRYELLHVGKLSDVPATEPLVTEKAPVDEKYELLYKIGAFGYSFDDGVGVTSGSGRWAPTDIERLKPFTKQ